MSNTKPKQKKPRLKPSKRMKKRYVLFFVDRRVKKAYFERAFLRHVFSLYGARAFKEIAPKVIELHSSGLGILRCSRQGLERIERAFGSFEGIEQNVRAKILAESGTIKSLRKRMQAKHLNGFAL